MPLNKETKIKSQRAYIVAEENKIKTFLLIYMAVPKDNSLTVKEYDIINKYKNLDATLGKCGFLKLEM